MQMGAALIMARRLVFHDADKLIALDDHAAITGRIGGAETQRREVRTGSQLSRQAGKRGWREKRRVAEEPQELAVESREPFCARENRVGRSQLAVLRPRRRAPFG